MPFSSRSTRSSRVPRLVPRFLLSTRIVPFTFPPHLHPLAPCALLPPCIDAKPSCVIYAHASPVLCALTSLRHVACRALLGSCVGVSCHCHLTHHFPYRSPCALFGLPSHSTSSITLHFSPSHGAHHIALPRIFSSNISLLLSYPHREQHLAILALPPVRQAAITNNTLRHSPKCQPHHSPCCPLMCAVCYFLHSARP